MKTKSKQENNIFKRQKTQREIEAKINFASSCGISSKHLGNSWVKLVLSLNTFLCRCMQTSLKSTKQVDHNILFGNSVRRTPQKKL